MKKTERHNKILMLLDMNQQATYQELTSYLQISEATVRRDLDSLEQAGQIIRFWGGAKRNPNHPINQRNIVEGILSKEKRVVGEIAASLVNSHELIFIGSGTTTLTMIDYLTATDIMVVTNGIPQLESLHSKKINAFLLCGFYKSFSSSLVGRQTIEMLEKYQFDKVFLGTYGLNENLAPLSADEYEHEIKKICLKNSKQSYILADNTKYNRSSLYVLEKENYNNYTLITNRLPDNSTNAAKILNGFLISSSDCM